MEAVATKKQLVQDLITRVHARLGGELPAGADTGADIFVENYCAGLAFADLAGGALDDHCGALCSLIKTGMQRLPGRLEVRIFNPTREEHGWHSDHTVIEMVNDDMPFLVDSVSGELGRREIAIHLAVHPQIRTRRGALGELLSFYPAEVESPGSLLESFMHLEIDQIAGQVERVELETALGKVLADVRAAVEDWPAMRRALQRLLEEFDINPPPLKTDELNEARQFLRFIDDHFTFLGFVDYTLSEEAGAVHLRPDLKSGLGILRKLPLDLRAHADQPVPPAVRDFLLGDQLVSISKASRRATVHRTTPMDRIAVKKFDPTGKVVGECEFLGLFTSLAYSIPASEIPMVAGKVERVIDRAGFLPASHNAKGLRHLLENYPRDELLQISEDDLFEVALRILDLELRPRPALFVRRDEAERFVSCMVFVPRDQHNSLHRRRLQAILESNFNGEVTSVYIWMTDQPLARVQFIVKTHPGQVPAVDVQAIEAQLAEVLRLWSDRLREALIQESGEAGGMALWRLYNEAFPAAYQEQPAAIRMALADIPLMEEVRRKGGFALRLYRPVGQAASRFHLRTFEFAAAKRLSRILPMLENMGLEVEIEVPFAVQPKGADHPLWVRDFELVALDAVDLEAARDNFTEAFTRVWDSESENDRFNRLVLTAGLTWREVIILRAYCKYLRQTGTAFSERSMADTLAKHARFARSLVDLFHAEHDPDLGEERRSQGQAIRGLLQEALAKVDSLDEDRILRRFLNLVEATLRTNYFQRGIDTQPKPYLAFKFECAQIRDLPAPRPLYEIFVYSPRVEAVHLRSGKVARGGVRWSDRREDFRTEVLGLMKAQVVKNAVIVPMGAKGGFVVKMPPTEREALQAEGIACYKTMIRGLLDLTDNLQGNLVVPPPRVIRRDGDDPYLVVAADKGTATFSDIANQLSREYGFWLGDAFASGGSAGYDHKKMGITARGAWESVKRHFRELGHDVMGQDTTVIGVGDMSGDVFGNGMLLSSKLQLIAAFNHQHIFLDPNPDCAASLAERTRLFHLPRSTWEDYDRQAISSGGGVFRRDAKIIPVSPEVGQRFGLSTAEITPNELVRGLLATPVDLLWFGGIGTFVKASHETDAAVGDRANDEVRVDGRELRARVVGEGANLGLTQAGRVEFALAGGRLNTDFIDNSGGVDCSDHEVNIKIALADALAAGDLALAQRNQLLSSMTPQVSALVLRDNTLQAQAISLIAAHGVQLLDSQQLFMRQLERSGQLDRRLAGLPDDATLEERREARKGLTRPEIAVLLAYGKMQLYAALLDSDLPDEPQLVEDLVRYFPEPMQTRFRPAIERHRLRREIIATHVANSLVNRVGPSFATRLAAETGRSLADIARAYAVARDVFGLRALWEEIEALDHQVAAEQQIAMYRLSIRLIEQTAHWFLRYGGRPLYVTSLVQAYQQDIALLAADLDTLIPAASERIAEHCRRLTSQGVPPELARKVAGLEILPALCYVARGARTAAVPAAHFGRLYFAVGDRFGFGRLRQAAGEGEGNAFQQTAAAATIDDLCNHQAELTQQVLCSSGPDPLAAWAAAFPATVQRLDHTFQDCLSAEKIDLAVLVIVERELRALLAGR